MNRVAPSVANVPVDLFHSQLSGAGVVRDLEQRFADYYGKRYALAVANATLGLYAVSLALDLSERVVVTTPLSWGGTIAGAFAAGARIEFSDVDSRTLGLRAGDIMNRQLTRSAAAIVAVDYLGVPADDDALRRVADGLGAWYIHDAAQSFGARIEGRPAGSRAHVVVVSLSAGKGLSAGEGGVIVTDDADLYDRLVWLTQHPDRQKRDLGLGHTNEFALNMRINPLAAWWAVMHFDLALEEVRRRAATSGAIVRAIDASGLSVALGYEHVGLEPSFFRLTASWCGTADPGALALLLSGVGARGAEVRPAMIIPLYDKYPRGGRRTKLRRSFCRRADHEAACRFEVLHPGIGEASVL